MSLSSVKSNLEIFGETLLDLALNDKDIIAVTSDSRGSGQLTKFAHTLPDQIVEIGIAEQNLVGVSAGLAAMGKKVFAVSPGSFLSARALEQIKNDIAYSNFPVKLIGISSGVSYGAYGSTHHSTHDFAALLAISNLDLIVPADNSETRESLNASMHHSKPVYIRLGRKKMPDFKVAGSNFHIGKGIKLRDGSDACIIATGETVWPAIEASDVLAQQGISCRVVSMHTLRPFDFSMLESIASSVHAILTCEEHSLHGGLGSICASFLLQRRYCLPFGTLGIPDFPIKAGSQEEVFDFYGLNANSMAQKIRQLLAS